MPTVSPRVPHPADLRPGPGRGRTALVLLTVVLALAGCSGGEDDTTATSTNSTATTRPPTTATTTVSPLPPSTVAAPAGSTISQPDQPTSGPGSNAQPHRAWRESHGGSGADAWYVFEPADPAPASAPVVVILHGYYEFSGYQTMEGLIRHSVLGGSIVIYPRWQTDTAVPCPGPFDPEPCVRSATTAIHDALAFLRTDPSRVQPEADHADYVGLSFGGILATDLANRWQALGLPEPRTVFLDDPHDGGYGGKDEPAVDGDLSGIPATALLVCHVGSQGVISEEGQADSSCNAFFNRLSSLPASHKRLVLTFPDDHGRPVLTSHHGVCGTLGGSDAYDWGFCWRVWDAMRMAAGTGDDLTEVLPLPPGRLEVGAWSDGTPITSPTVTARAPVRP